MPILDNKVQTHNAEGRFRKKMVSLAAAVSPFEIDLIVAAIMLLFTSYLDMKKREVDDKVWIIFGVIGGTVQVFAIAYHETSVFALLLSVVLSTIIGMGLFFFGFYGGADGKALVVLGILVPTFAPRVGIYSIAPLMILTNGVLLSILLPIVMLFLNLSRLLRKQPIFDGFQEPWYRKVAACFLGFKQTGEPHDFQFSMEKESNKENPGGKKFQFSMMQEDFETKGNTWVTPGIPLLVFFTAGYFVMLAYGDLVIAIVQSVSKFVGF